MKKFFWTAATVFVLTIIFCLQGFAANEIAGKVKTDGGRLNLRRTASTGGSVVTSVKNGSWLTLKAKSGNWWKVEYADGKEAYASADYITSYPKTYKAVVNISSGALNVRRGADTTYAVKDKLYKGEEVLVVKSNSTWCGILYEGNRTGFVSKAYLKKASQLRYPEIKMSVQNFKQTDSRWSSYPIGTTGGTIGSIGCTTTALAIVESYHSGKTVTPPEMAKRLSYSSGGSLYWPSTHSVSNATSSYLSEIYELLKKGKPVVFGMKTPKGNQHWVVVYGYKGGDSLTADKFLISDPGSNSRLTLQSVLNAYPNAYRIVYKK